MLPMLLGYCCSLLRFDWNFTSVCLSLPAVPSSQRASPASLPLPLPWLPLCPPCQSACWHIYVFNKQHDRLKMSALSTVIQNVTTASRRIQRAQKGEAGRGGRAGQPEGAERAQDALDYLTFCMAHRIMNEINLISAINALVVSKFGRPRNRGDFMFIIIDSWVLLPLSAISPPLVTTSALSLVP